MATVEVREGFLEEGASKDEEVESSGAGGVKGEVE